MDDDKSYALNLSDGVLHQYPAFESCNLDDTKELKIFIRTPEELALALAEKDEHFKRGCRRCFKM
jgi:hypothetical protein